MDTREEFRRYMTAVSREENRLRRHLREDELIEYQQGRLEDSERDEIQSHLVHCDECLAAFKDVSDFFEPAREGEETLSEAEIAREWRTFWPRVRAEAEIAALAPGGRRAGFWLSRRAAFALAASVLVAVGLTGTWAWQLKQGQQQLARQWRIEQERVRELEQETRRWQEQANALQQTYESQLAELRQPQLNTPSYDVMTQDFIQRSGEEVQPVRIPPMAKSFRLILIGQSQPHDPDYVVEIINRNGQPVWRGEGLKRDGNGDFVMTLQRAFLPPGEYRLKVYGQRGRGSRMMGDYTIRIE
jgi:hypothetical protein